MHIAPFHSQPSICEQINVYTVVVSFSVLYLVYTYLPFRVELHTPAVTLLMKILFGFYFVSTFIALSSFWFFAIVSTGMLR